MNFNPNFGTNRFKKISADAFIELYKQKNPDLITADLKKDLTYFKKLKLNGEKCNCGNPIWVVGSAISGKGCFTCITGESYTDNDYEME
jgi:hypothetical protein